MTVNSETKGTDTQNPIEKANTGVNTLIRIEKQYDDRILTRLIQFTESHSVLFGRATGVFPPKINNALFTASVLSFKHCRVWMSETELFINPIQSDGERTKCY